MSKEQKLSVAGLLAVLVAGVFMPLAIAQGEPPGAWTGTWVGSYKARRVSSFVDSYGTTTYGQEFTVYLTLTFKGWEYTGRQTIVYDKFYWITSEPDLIATGASISPREFDVAIHGFIAVDNHLYLLPDQTVTCRVAFSSRFRTNLPGEPEKWESGTDVHEEELHAPFIDVGVARIGNDIMRVSESHSSTENLETITISSSYYAAGALVLQKEGEIEIKTTCLAVQGPVLVQHTGAAWKEALDPGMVLEPGDRIITETDGKAVILLPDGAQVNLDSSTSVTVEELLETGNLMLTLELGKLHTRVSSFIEGIMPKKKINVHTPVAVTGRRGTEFILEVSEDGTTTLLVLEGTVDFSDLQISKTVTVGENETSTVKPGGVPSEPMAVDLSEIEAWWEEKPVEKTETTEITNTSITQTVTPTTVTMVSTASSETITTSSTPTIPLPTTSIITTAKETETSAATETTVMKPPVTTTLGPTFPVSTSTIVILAAVIVAAALAVVALRRLSKKKQDEQASLTSPWNSGETQIQGRRRTT